MAPALICSCRPAGKAALPLPKKPRFIGKASAACIMRSMFQGPGVQVVAKVPVAGPVPPPSMVVTPLANGICIHVGQKRAAGVLAYLRCHLAFARAHGYGGASLCAFAIPDVTAQATADYKGVELTSQNPQAVKILQSLVLAPFHGI